MTALINAWQLPLAQLCDSALPTGAFSHSFGLETYVAEQVVTDEASFTVWLRQIIQTQLTYGDGLAIRQVVHTLTGQAAWPHQDGLDLDGVWQIDQQSQAQTLARQVRQANQAMGKRMAEIAQLSVPTVLVQAYAEQIDQGTCHGHPAIVLALVGACLEAPTAAIVAAHLQAVATSLTQNGVRAIPLGQNAGQRTLAAIRSDIEACLGTVATATPHEFGATVPGLEIAQMRHERLRARMYMS